jgi:hypothetical protein
VKRHVYTSPAERRRDRHLGFLAFIVVNAITWLAYSALRQHAIQLAEEAAAAAAKLPPGMSMHFANPPVPLAIQILPWLVNGLILAIGLIFRPEFALGYMACFGMILLVCGGLATIVVMSCVATIISALILPPLAPVVFFVLVLVGLYYFGRWAIPAFFGWWDAEEQQGASDTPPEA